jgi:nucleoside-diphosphate-sugar epimerase
MEVMSTYKECREQSAENRKKIRTVLLTGNTGYIGTVMTERLKKASYEVVGLDSGLFAENCLYEVPGVALPDKQIIKDVRSIAGKDLDGIDAVIHLAGLSNDPLGELNPALTDEINCESTTRLARLAKSKGIGRFIFASSCSIYGISDSGRAMKEDGELRPLTAYAKAKVAAESELSKLADGSFHPVLMRNATVYGLSPRLRLDLVVNNLLAWAFTTGEVAIMSDGTPWRPVIHVQDFCAAFLAALEAPVDAVHCQAINVGKDEEMYQVREIAEEVRKAVSGSRVKILNKAGNDERSYRVDFSKIKKILPDFRPQWTLKGGIEELLGAYRKHELSRDKFNSDKYFRIRAIKSLMESGRVDKELMFKEVAR